MLPQSVAPQPPQNALGMPLSLGGAELKERRRTLNLDHQPMHPSSLLNLARARLVSLRFRSRARDVCEGGFFQSRCLRVYDSDLPHDFDLAKTWQKSCVLVRVDVLRCANGLLPDQPANALPERESA